jgi:hypothetical protein
MALKPVTDPNLLTALNSAPAPDPATVPGPKPVTDPALLAQLNAPEQPAAPDPLGADQVPVPAATPAPAAPQANIWEQFLNKAGLDQRDPVLDMAGHGLVAAAKGAPEVAANMVGNTGVQAVAGLTAPFVSENMGDATNFIQDFTAENSMRPQGESAKFLTEGLGEAFAPVENVKQGLGEGVEALGGNADAAATASMLPDFLMALAGGPSVVKGGAELPTKVRPPEKPISPTVDSLRAADIRLRPSDVRAMNPDKRVKVPGEFRERFADAPDLKADTTLHNQARFTDIAAKEIGAKALDEASLAKAKETPAATYDMVEQALMDKPMSPEFQTVFREAAQSARLPKGEGSSVTRIIGALRRRAAKRMQNDQVATEEAGFADRELADRLEEALGKELEAVGEPQLLGEYRAARQQFAKIHDIETATRAGQIDANVVYKLGQRGTKLSGGLKLIADAAENLPNVTGHSLKTAARAGNEIPTTFAGGITELGKKAVRLIPGMDVGAPGFQSKFGKADPARASYYGKDADIAPVRGAEQGDLDLREALELEAPPGAVGTPQRSLREPGSQIDMLGEAFDFEAPPGVVGAIERGDISLQELLGLGEPLTMKQPPGRVGKPKRTQ